MTVQNRQHTAGARRRDFLRFVPVNGALGWGLTTAALSALIQWAWTGAPWTPGRLVVSCIVYAAVGLLWGAAMWGVRGRRHRRAAPRA